MIDKAIKNMKQGELGGKTKIRNETTKSRLTKRRERKSKENRGEKEREREREEKERKVIHLYYCSKYLSESL